VVGRAYQTLASLGYVTTAEAWLGRAQADGTRPQLAPAAANLRAWRLLGQQLGRSAARAAWLRRPAVTLSRHNDSTGWRVAASRSSSRAASCGGWWRPISAAMARARWR
jgi:GH15 family glucan-1,4-alpha-glucosidase